MSQDDLNFLYDSLREIAYMNYDYELDELVDECRHRIERYLVEEKEE